MSLPNLVQTKLGREIEHRGKRGNKRTITVNREWDVYLDDVKIGSIVYRLMTREQRTPGRRYVNSRWESPGWEAITVGSWRGLERSSKKDAIEYLVWRHERNSK